MKKILFSLAALFMLSSNILAEESHMVQVDTNTTQEEKSMIPQEAMCQKCGMMLSKEYKTEHIDSNGEKYCSVECVAKSMAEGKKITGLKVIDNTTLKFVDVIKVWYVKGSSQAGASDSKYAFTKKSDAEKFAKEFGGNVVTFYTLIK